jgi:hypothetical protein
MGLVVILAIARGSSHRHATGDQDVRCFRIARSLMTCRLQLVTSDSSQQILHWNDTVEAA